MAHQAPPEGLYYDAHFAAVGRLTDAWARLELNIDQAIWRLADTQHALGACITAQLIGVNRRLMALRSLVVARGGKKTAAKLGTFAGSLSGLQTKRDRAVHDVRLMNTQSGKIDRLQITAQNKPEFGWKAETKETLQETQEKILEKIGEFTALFVEIGAELDSLRDEDRPPLPQIVSLNQGSEVPTTDS